MSMNKQTRPTRALHVACLAAAATMAFAVAARADVVTTTTTTTTQTSDLAAIPTILPPPLGPNGQPIDYNCLINSPFNYMDLQRAHDDGFSDADVARIAKISVVADVPFNDVLHQALAGQTFSTLAYRYNMRLYDVWDASDYEAKIADYKLAYEHSGKGDVPYLVAAEQQEMYTTPYGSTVISTEPAGTQNIADLVDNTPNLSKFSRALHRARLTKVLRGSGQYTVFAPTDAAWDKLSPDQVNDIMADRNALTKIIDYCIVPRRVDAASALSMSLPSPLSSLEGDSLTITSSGSTLMVNGATVVTPDMYATNGIVHEIDTLLIPPTVSVIDGQPASSYMSPSTTLAPSTTIAPSSTTSVSPNGTTTTVTPNSTTTVEPNGSTTVQPNEPGSTLVSPAPNGGTTVTPAP
jgi:uncharacterized surface protein with fasciclin (FAS1) repeats